ncbi:putative receptor protein kinase zmpk1 [Quercus suber]|uniref:Receptor protein kinase zmpk1 n=1 Tax=Quercus suber TaxID=58331 RepID=A0AAW0M575_QUESU
MVLIGPVGVNPNLISLTTNTSLSFSYYPMLNSIVQYAFEKGDCFLKSLLLNGYHSPDFQKDIYLRLLKNYSFFYNSSVEEFSLDCSRDGTIQLERTYVKSRVNGIVKFMLWFACGVGGLEVICIFVVWCLLIKTQKSSGANNQGYALTATGFRKFTYAKLKKATKGFTEEIRIGAWGVVYKGLLSDNRVAAIKLLNEANQGEDAKNREATTTTTTSWIEDIIDPTMEGIWDMVALQCVEEDKDARPTMSQVVKMLVHCENGST